MNVGAVEWFEPGEYDRVERVLERMRSVGMKHLRAGISWADAARDDNARWLDWLLPRLAKDADVIPCFVGTPPEQGVEPHPTAPPRDPRALADFLDAVVERHGEHFEWVELWDAPNHRTRWDAALDPDGTRFAAMVDAAARRMHERGKKVLLGGMDPVDPAWLERLQGHGVLEHVDAVGVHAFPSAEAHWRGWEEELGRVRAVLEQGGAGPELWLTAVGHSTVRHDDVRQLALAQEVLDLPVARAYWHTIDDVPEDRSGPSGFHADEREYHAGLWRADGSPKLLARVLLRARDPRGLRWMVQEEALSPGADHVVVTGGAGFVGVNLADRLLRGGHSVLVYDDLSRDGSLDNLEWLRSVHGNALRVRVADVRDRFALRQAVRGARAVFHLAAQTAVTTSLEDPRGDFEVNAEGTLNVLEAVRREAPDAFVLYASTNKVYGALDDVTLVERPTRWEPRHGPLRRNGDGHGHGPGVSFATPYGCSKGAADQYVLDHARTLGLDATVFRMSCIYGPHQNGTEDQGWVAHFLRSAREGRQLTIYGDGKQVRDVLHVDDLVDAYVRAMDWPEAVVGRAWDVGGGGRNTVSLLELLGIMEDVGCPVPPVAHEAARPSDQRYYVSDVGPLRQALGWAPTIGVRQGIERVWRGEDERAPPAREREVVA